MPLFNFSTGGALDGMKTMLKNNELIKKKANHFEDKSRGKYKNKDLKTEKAKPEDIKRIKAKIKKQERNVLIKKLIIFAFSLGIVILLILKLMNKI